ncbi:hypothetical protein H4Q26_016593 [Puccinia striiformis f. sp. tritici PST-130]|nr:hypothetical protein H4Q26_016593 [Puccinia striiformis f. sp. tritici PST-130]
MQDISSMLHSEHSHQVLGSVIEAFTNLLSKCYSIRRSPPNREYPPSINRASHRSHTPAPFLHPTQTTKPHSCSITSNRSKRLDEQSRLTTRFDLRGPVELVIL